MQKRVADRVTERIAIDLRANSAAPRPEELRASEALLEAATTAGLRQLLDLGAS